MAVLLLLSAGLLAVFLILCTHGSTTRSRKSVGNANNNGGAPGQATPGQTGNTEKELALESKESKASISENDSRKKKDRKKLEFKLDQPEGSDAAPQTNLDSVRGEKNPLMSKRVQNKLRHSAESLSKENVAKGGKGTKEKGSKDEPDILVEKSAHAPPPPSNLKKKGDHMDRSTAIHQARSRQEQEVFVDDIADLAAKKAADKLREEKIEKNIVRTPVPEEPSGRSKNHSHSGYM